ncbi:MAG: histidine kinase [Bacteroidia bacterium]|nr:histidine kinase [Bacteroidia bacterium]
MLRFYQEAAAIRSYRIDPDLKGEFEGNDWVNWEDTPKGVIAADVHPLPSYKPTDRGRIRRGDRLRSVDYTEITQAEVAEQIFAAARPGYAFVVILERTDPYSLTVEEVRTYIKNGFRLAFSFNSYAVYWHIGGWMVGAGFFVALIMLAILFPIARSNWRGSLSLLGMVAVALIFFLVQLFHHLYLIVESDLESIRVEKAYALLYSVLLFGYAAWYFRYKSGLRAWYWMLPSAAAGIFLLASYAQWIWADRQMRFYHDLIERSALQYFLLHLAAAVLLSLADGSRRSLRSLSALLGVSVLALAGFALYSVPQAAAGLLREHALMGVTMLMFFPLVNAAFPQLQFGKVSLVITQTIQYLVALVVSIVLFLLIRQLFDYIRPGIQYRQLMEFTVFLLLIALLRVVYLANENRFTKYFVSAQRERDTKFRSFIARIPQYTNSAGLRSDLEAQLMEFFNAESVYFWWSTDEPETEAAQQDFRWYEDLYLALVGGHAVWSRTKEISPFPLEEEMEKRLLRTPYSLVTPVTVDKETYALLMLGRKRRGVYNLYDLELISQLVQQTQLTLNVLQLVNREKELIQQTYEANLTALRSQINPHFLFNTLNSIGELVHESADLAEQAVQKLAYIFRYTLRMSSQNFVTLAEEMSLIRTYLDLEKIRFGDRLENRIQVGPEVNDVPIPAFILSTLVENCIKHGVSKILGKGIVSVTAFKDGEFLVCEVVDNGPGIDLSRLHKSTGLSNSIARLENIYNLKHLLYFENTGNGTYVRLKIPLAEKTAPAPVSGA